MRFILSLLVVAACSTDEATSPDADAMKIDPLPGIGEACGELGACAAGLRCDTYFGIAGSGGPSISTCEINCEHAECPSALTCVSLADGPGRVCR